MRVLNSCEEDKPCRNCRMVAIDVASSTQVMPPVLCLCNLSTMTNKSSSLAKTDTGRNLNDLSRLTARTRAVVGITEMIVYSFMITLIVEVGLQYPDQIV